MRNLPEPESQMQEVLYELLNRTFIDRRTMMLSCGVMNLTARISNLRQMGCVIISNKILTLNKFGREVEFVQYNINNKMAAREIYLKMKSNQLNQSSNGSIHTQLFR